MKRKPLLLLLVLCQCQAVPAPEPEPEPALSFRPQLLFTDNNEACAIADVNLDGLLDITAGRNWYAAPDFAPQPLRNLLPHGQDYAQNNGEYIWDVDQDGYKDLISTGWENPTIRWYKNPGPEDLRNGLLCKKPNWLTHEIQGARQEISTILTVMESQNTS